MSEPVREQSEKRRGEDRCEEHPAIGEARLLQREPFGMLEILDCVSRSEREEHGGIEHMQREDIPVRQIEIQELAPFYLLHCDAERGLRPMAQIKPVIDGS